MACIGSQEKAQAVMYRLRDNEIRLFASTSPDRIKEYAQKHAVKELRWQIIVRAYFCSLSFIIFPLSFYPSLLLHSP